ncbi:hypothetical protein COOONC_19783 [Cooperia oncophora]
MGCKTGQKNRLTPYNEDFEKKSSNVIVLGNSLVKEPMVEDVLPGRDILTAPVIRHDIRPVYSSDDGEEFDSFLEDELGGPDAFRASQNRLEEREAIGQKIEQALSEVTAVVNVLINIDTDEALEKLREIHELLDRASKITLVPSSQEPENTVQSEHAGSEVEPISNGALPSVTLQSEHAGPGVEPISNGALPSILELSRKDDVDNREDKQSRNCEITDAAFFPPRRQRSLRNTSAVIGEADGLDTASLSTSIR